MKLEVHHVEVCVSDPRPLAHILQSQFGFAPVATRHTPHVHQILFRLHKAAFLLTTRNQIILHPPPSPAGRVPFPPEPWTVFCCEDHDSNSNSHVDSVFNVALIVSHLPSTLATISAAPIHPAPQIIAQGEASDKDGKASYAVVATACGNLVHTLIQKQDYSGPFLPGFQALHHLSNTFQIPPEPARLRATRIDHLALACPTGHSGTILEWYERVFGMKRFLTNREDTEEDGLVIGGDVGMRLKVLEFWRCSEQGVRSSSEDHGDDTEEGGLKIVVVESLRELKNVQIEGFLAEHGGPGLQHIGLHTEDIINAVRRLKTSGVRFRQPPPAYYTHIGQLSSILASGEDPNLLEECGILLDDEADAEADDFQEKGKQRYLMQVFTFPIFGVDTFFLEVIQRKGATGFGVGNVTALARSIRQLT